MDRIIKPMDLVALIGMGTSIAGIILCLFLLFVPVTFGAAVPEVVASGSVDLQVSIRWMQPLLGQAIVEETLIKQQHEREISGAVKVSKRMTTAGHRFKGAKAHVRVSTYAEAMQVDHAARVEWIMGRLIVELTRHGAQAGTSSADQLADGDDQRSITIAQEAIKKLDDVFRPEWQARLGRAIVNETLNQAHTGEVSPERAGLIF